MASPRTSLHVVVVGCGPVAARLISELRPALETGAVRVTVLGEEPEPAYQRIRLGEVASGRIDGAELAMLDPAELAEIGVEVRCRSVVTAIDRDRRTVELLSDGVPGSLGWDRLVLATGSEALVPDFAVSGTLGPGISVRAKPGQRPVGVMALRDLAEARRLHEAVRAGEPVVVLGGGVLGVEVALALAETGAEVTLLHRGRVPLDGQLDADGGRLLLRELVAAGVTFRGECSVQELVLATNGAGSPHLTALRTTLGQRIPASLLVTCTGVMPRDALAAQAGLETLPRGGVVVDRDGRCTDDHAVFAVGDCAAALGARPSGLIGPGWQQAAAAALALRADAGSPAPVERNAAGQPVAGQRPARLPGTSLEPIIVKSHTLSVACAGSPVADPWDLGGPSVSTWSEPALGQYLRVVTHGRRLLGFVAIGLPRCAAELSRHAQAGTLPPADCSALLAMEHAAGDRELGPDDVLCRCSGATVAEVGSAVAECSTVDEVGARCGAGTGCGSCRRRIVELLAS